MTKAVRRRLLWSAGALLFAVAAMAWGIEDVTASQTGFDAASDQATLATSTSSRSMASVPVSRPIDLPGACREAPQKNPVSPPPLFPTGYTILDALPSALASQYPSVYGGGGLVGGTTFVVLETVRDPLLEHEAAQAGTHTVPPLTMVFEVVPHSFECLTSVQDAVSSSDTAAARAGINLIGMGLQQQNVSVSVSNCGTDGARARAWFEERWGRLVDVEVCQQIPTADVLMVPTAKAT